MTIELPELLPLIGIICGTIVVTAVVFVAASLLMALGMDTWVGEFMYWARWLITFAAGAGACAWLISLS